MNAGTHIVICFLIILFTVMAAREPDVFVASIHGFVAVGLLLAITGKAKK